MTFYVYILYSDKLNKYYTGQTNDLEDRLHRHNSSQEKFTSKGVPWKFIMEHSTGNKSSSSNIGASNKKARRKEIFT
jgi:putative endonuclease